MNPISVCIIMKNEEKHIENCLKALISHGFGPDGVNGEIVLVDTGSTDQSVTIAQKYLPVVHHFDWINDFAAAKNYAASLAVNDWILIIDTDEYMQSFDAAAVQEYMQHHTKEIGTLLSIVPIEENDISTKRYFQVERMFHRKFYHFIYPIHEQLVPIDNCCTLGYHKLPVSILHYGYFGSEEMLQKKAARNNEILFRELKKRPEDPYLYFQIGQSYLLLRDYESACEWFGKGLAYDIDPKMEYAQMMVIGYGDCLLATGREKEAMDLLSVYDDFCDTPEFVFLAGQIYMNNDMYLKAYAEFIKCLSMVPNRTEGVTTFFAYHNIAVINEVLGNKEMAIEFYKKAGDYPRSKERLKELLDSQ